MADQKKKRVVLTLEEKINAIKKLDRGIPAYRIAEELGVGKTQIQSLRKRKAELTSDYENNVPANSKRRRYLTGNEEVNDLTLAWVKDAVSRRINVTGPLIQTKALEFATDLGKTDFKASKGWLESFKLRNNLVFGTMSGERGDVNIQSVQDWKNKLSSLCDGYEPKNILNMDETGLFFRDTSRQTFHFKGDDCAGGKRSKERVTVLLCASAAGEKFKPLLIGKSREPRCFKNVKTSDLPVHYYFNSKAWMNSSIYEDYLQKLNKKLKAEKRKVLLFVDNAPSHPKMLLSHITVKFLPPNTTSYTQPMDQGIIQSMKLKFRKRQLNHMVKEMDMQPAVPGPALLKQINILDAVYWVNNSWREVEETTIQKCFHKAGFLFHTSNDTCDIPSVLTDSSDADGDSDCDSEDDVPLAVLRLSNELFGCSFKDLINIDKNTHTCDTNPIDWDRPSKDLLSEINNECYESDSDEDLDETVSVQIPTLMEATKMTEQLKIFALDTGRSNIMDLVSQLEDELAVELCQSKKQTKITDFFNRP